MSYYWKPSKAERRLYTESMSEIEEKYPSRGNSLYPI